MAFVGMKYCVAAPIETEVRGQPLTYDPGIVVGKAIGANITLTRNSEPLYADDAVAESDNSLTGGTVEINVDDISDEAQGVILSVTKTAAADNGPDVYHETGDPSPYIGFGYLRVRRLNGVTSYVAYWIHKTQLAIASETASTKAGSITWQTPSVSGPIMGVVNGSDAKNHFRDHASFDSEDAAVAWLNKRAGILSA